MPQQLWTTFGDLIAAPFHHVELMWGVVPLYFAWALNELASSKATYRTALQSGFSFLWAGAHWLYPYFKAGSHVSPAPPNAALPTVNAVVAVLVLVTGAVALVSGLRRRFPRHASFLGHTRFSNYFMIAVYPMQAHCLAWTWNRLAAVLVFSVPLWLVLHFGLMPIRNRP